MAYFTRNKKWYKPNKLIIMPYLHERKVYLNKMKPTSQYFYTSLKPNWNNDKLKDTMDSLCSDEDEDVFDDNDKGVVSTLDQKLKSEK